MAGGMAPYLRLVRPLNVFMAAAGVAVGGVVAVRLEGLAAPMAGTSNVPLAVALAWAAASAALFTAAGNVLNDYFDRETDKVNHPERPIPSGLVTPTEARRFAVTLFVVSAAALGGAGSLLLGVLWVLNLAAMVAYERSYKGRGLGGNLLIAYLVGSLFLFGGVATTSAVVSDAVLRVAVLASLAAVATLGREIVKDIEDVAGDVDRVTLPMRIGVGPAASVAAAFFGAAVVLSAVPWIANVLGLGYLLVAASDGIFIYAAAVSLRRPAASERAAKYAMLAALLAFLLGGLT